MVGQQAHFFVELAEHRLLWRLTMLDAALRELPGMGADAFAPKYLVPVIEQDDADVRPKAFPVEHNQLRIFQLVSLLHRNGLTASSLCQCLICAVYFLRI